MVIKLERWHLWLVGAALLLLVLAFFLNRRQARHVPSEAVWSQARTLGAAHDLDPRFLFAIAMAESSLNANADSGYARGLMQVSEAAWTDMTPMDYREAFDWRTNMDVATRYLAHLRDRLVEAGHFDYARLAAAYRHGYNALADEEFSVAALPAPRNAIYRELFQGRIPRLANKGA